VERLASVIALGLVLVGLAGCATTQQEAARLRIRSARLRASQVPVRVTAADLQVRVASVAIVRGAGEAAVVVRVRNLVGHPLTDLPISVGLTGAAGERVYLNGAAGLGYFRTHLPGVAARGSLRWVFTTSRRLPARARPFAEVGRREQGVGPIPPALPAIAVELAPRSLAGGLAVIVRNRSSVLQDELQVYAIARRQGRYVAAGQASVATLGPGASAALRLRLAGDPVGSSVALEAAPTSFG
jgi:hypothetical protein